MASLKLSKRFIWVLGFTLVMAAAVSIIFFLRTNRNPNPYMTEPVTYGDITQTVSANGTINPVKVVNVGSQVSGTVQSIYVDFNSRVKAGEVLLRLDPTLLQAQIQQDKASLHGAEANLFLATANLKRSRTMYKSGYVTRADLDQLEAAQKTAQAQVESSRAQLTHDLANLNFSVIRSPVNGVVISRNVDVGQTVAASFQTPTLFQIGENLKKMQIDVTVDESDIGLIKVGQRAVFTVDAYPSQSFTGRVAQIRLNATIVQNVVTYDVVVNFDNPKEQLLPGMTAYVNIVIATRNHVVTVPNAALRVRLPLKVKPIAVKGKGATGLIYVLRKSGPEAISVKTGLTNGIRTEIVRGAVKPGQKVIVGIKTNSSATGRRRSVFGGH